MRIAPILRVVEPKEPDWEKLNQDLTFTGYNSELKTLYKKGKLPQVRRGFYGEKLTQKNLSLEHLQAKSAGGTTTLDNLVLASKQTNNARGNKPLRDFINLKHMAKYLEQFQNIHIKSFDGNEYIKMILQKVSELL